MVEKVTKCIYSPVYYPAVATPTTRHLHSSGPPIMYAFSYLLTFHAKLIPIDDYIARLAQILPLYSNS